MSVPAQSRRAADALATLAAAGPVSAADLDAAGIPHWRERLAAASEQDWRESKVERGRHYDLVARALRSELGRDPLPVEVAPPPEVPRYPNRQERIYDPDVDEEPF